MIIHSPVGRFPFEADSVEIHGGQIRLSGAMGTWPTSLEVPVSELPRIMGRLLPVATIAKTAAVAGLLMTVARWRSRSRDRRSA